MADSLHPSDILVTYSPRSPDGTWERQRRTADAISMRFRQGIDTVLLADEVGMGKTYVALATMAEYLLQSDANDRKVLLVTPPSSVLRVKWQQEIQSFSEHYLTDTARARKGLQAVVIHNYWDLLRNLSDFQNHTVQRVHEEDRRCFTWCLFEWAHDRKLLGKSNRMPWKSVADLGLRSPALVNFLSRYSTHAIWHFLDADYRLRMNHYKDLFRCLERDALDQPPRRSGERAFTRADITALLRAFAGRQDTHEPNIYIIGMNALARPRIDQRENRFLAKYLLSHLLSRRHADTWKTHTQLLVQANVLPDEFADKHSHRWRMYVESMDQLARTPFYGLQAAAQEVLAMPDVQADWRQLSDAIMRGDTSNAQAFFSALGARVFAAQLARANIGLAVVDEVHNWKGSAFGATAFQGSYAPGIARKLIMSATPFQMEEGEMSRVFGFVQAPAGGSAAVMAGLFAPEGEVPRCLAASQAFARAWQELSRTPAAAQRLHDLFADACMQELDARAAQAAADPAELEEVRAFCQAVLPYRAALAALQAAMGQVVVRHTKPRDKRHFHIGKHFPDTSPPYPRNGLYSATGHASEADALVNFVGMRLGQLALRGGDDSYEGNARLLGGLTSSTSAFLEGADGRAMAGGSDATRAYGDMFRKLLAARPHPKVAATVARAFQNFEAGRKTLIFCERVATLREIEQALAGKIDSFIADHGATMAVERQNLLKRREQLENLWWPSLWEAIGQRATGRQLLARYQAEARAFVVDCLARTRVTPSARRIINLLDTWLIGRAAGDGQLPAGDWSPAVAMIARTAALLEADRHREEAVLLADFLAPRRAPQELADPVATDDLESTPGSDLADIGKAVDTVLRQQYLERRNLWWMGDDHDFHPLLWQLLASEARQLVTVPADPAPAPGIAAQTAQVFQDVQDDLMTGIRKFTLRDDLLVRYERVSQAEQVLDRLAEGLRSMPIGHDVSMLARVTRFLQGLVAADGSISRANLTPSRRRSLWQGVSIGKVGHVATLEGRTPPASRAGLCAAFNSPLLPDILICTAIGSEGIDLHRQCADVIHHDLPWNPAKLEQRNGRVDRVGSLAQMSDSLLINLGIPFLANNYEQYQYQKVYSRAQKFEVLLGKPEFEAADIDEEGYAEDRDDAVIRAGTEAAASAGTDAVLPPLPSSILAALRLDLSVPGDRPAPA